MLEIVEVDVDVGVVNALESGREARGGVVVTDGFEVAVETVVVAVRVELTVDEAEVTELETVAADGEEASVTAPRKHEEKVAFEVDSP